MLKPGPFIHSKSNRHYTLLQTDIFHSETLEPHVLYRAEYGDRKTWVRPQRMWDELVEVEECTGPGETMTRKVPRFRSAEEKDLKFVAQEALITAREHWEQVKEFGGRIYWVPATSHVRLFEVDDCSLTTGECMPIRFAANADWGTTLEVEICVVNEAEFRFIKDGQMSTPAGWASMADWRLFKDGKWDEEYDCWLDAPWTKEETAALDEAIKAEEKRLDRLEGGAKL